MTTTETRPPLVVVGVDGSDESQKALDWAENYASTTDSELRLFIAWQFPAYLDAIAMPRYDWGAIAQKTIEKMAADLHMPQDKVTCVVHYGPAAASLVDQSRYADLLVLGSRGHGVFAGMRLGSVSTHCARQAHCPVVVVR